MVLAADERCVGPTTTIVIIFIVSTSIFIFFMLIQPIKTGCWFCLSVWRARGSRAMHALATTMADLMKMPPGPPMVSTQGQRLIDGGAGGTRVKEPPVAGGVAHGD